MSYSLIKELIDLVEEFEHTRSEPSDVTINSFAQWLSAKVLNQPLPDATEPSWVGKAEGRSPESVISTSIVHLFRYGRLYSKSALLNSPFTSIDDVIFLINLQHLGRMTKIKLIELNIQEKSTGIQIINRLIADGFVEASANAKDKRSKEICITSAGINALEEVMDRVRKATRVVAGDITTEEKFQLIKILQKLETYHGENSKRLNGSIRGESL